MDDNVGVPSEGDDPPQLTNKALTKTELKIDPVFEWFISKVCFLLT